MSQFMQVKYQCGVFMDIVRKAVEVMDETRIVLCAANAYEQKYYFNEDFKAIPDSIKEELKVICVLFTQEAGGILLFVFDEDGELLLETNADEEDITYDEISSGLLVREIRRNKQELLESLSLFYKLIVLGVDEDAAGN